MATYPESFSQSFFVGAFPAFLLSGNIVGIASGSSIALCHTELAVKAPFKARSVHYIRMSVLSVPTTTSLWSASL